jgi:hypothetical protein
MIYNLFKVSYKEASLQKRGFFVKDAHAARLLENIGIAFLDGYHHCLDIDDEAVLCRSLDQKTNLFRGFSYEGAAMGMAVKDAFKAKHNRYIPGFLSGKGNHHIYMLHVGIGWAYARLPFHVEKILPAYDPLLRWLIIDGYGFHEAYFKTEKIIRQQLLPKLSQAATHVFYQGVGRALWFICGTEVDNVAKTLHAFPAHYHADLWAGVGLAAVYAGGAQPAELQRLKAHTGDHLPFLLQGVAFAAKARERAETVTADTNNAITAITGYSLSAVADTTDRALLKVDTKQDAFTQYYSWRKMIAEDLYSKTLIA